MESLKIRDKKIVPPEEEIIDVKKEEGGQKLEVANPKTEGENIPSSIIEPPAEIAKPKEQARRSKPTFGQSLMDKVKKFFEEVEE